MWVAFYFRMARSQEFPPGCPHLPAICLANRPFPRGQAGLERIPVQAPDPLQTQAGAHTRMPEMPRGELIPLELSSAALGASMASRTPYLVSMVLQFSEPQFPQCIQGR